MIDYNREDHGIYLAERSFYLCSLAGIEPQFVDKTTYNSIREALYLTLSGAALRRALMELSGILYFSIVTSEAPQ